jgi:glycine dehydrogenase subunit 2
MHSYENLLFALSKDGRGSHYLPECDIPERKIENLIDKQFLRKRPPELPEVAENEIVRHYIALSMRNHHVDKAMYPLGSCTMKYNPKINEKLAANTCFSELHPEQEEDEVQGALQILYELQELLKEITGFKAVSLQPAAGAQGELVGLLLMQQYHLYHNQPRTQILIPDSAHGTNPASAAVAGFTIRTIKSNENGLINLDDLKQNISVDTAGLMLTNPNTLGIFEHQVKEIKEILDSVDALFYMDGANMNALFALVRPGEMGFDVMHLNLHKSFSTPHGGGGPGAGPVAVNERLSRFLPQPVVAFDGKKYYFSKHNAESIGRVHSFMGNFALCLRAYVYIRMVGASGFRKIAEHAIVNANYLYARLKDLYEIGYQSQPMHEFVLSAERQKERGVRALDIAKRLLDFGIHPPTVYFPLIVKEAMMIEPTETESKEMLDFYAEMLRNINDEIAESPELLHQAPHNTPVRRLDEAAAARNLNVNYYRNKRVNGSDSL